MGGRKRDPLENIPDWRKLPLYWSSAPFKFPVVFHIAVFHTVLHWHVIYPLPFAMDLPELWHNTFPDTIEIRIPFILTLQWLYSNLWCIRWAQTSLCAPHGCCPSPCPRTAICWRPEDANMLFWKEKRKKGIDFYTHVAFIKNIKYAHPAPLGASIFNSYYRTITGHPTAVAFLFLLFTGHSPLFLYSSSSSIIATIDPWRRGNGNERPCWPAGSVAVSDSLFFSIFLYTPSNRCKNALSQSH